MKAERDAGIQPRPTQPKRKPAGVPTPSADSAAAALNTAWLNAGTGSSDAWTLAAHYHRAIIKRLPSAVGSKYVQPNQVTSWLNEFLSLESRPRTGHLPELFKNFLRAWVWCSTDTEHPLYARVCERYVSVLYECSLAVTDEFKTQQPEADISALLSAEGFPGKAPAQRRAVHRLVGLVCADGDTQQPVAAHCPEPQGRVSRGARDAPPLHTAHRRDKHRQNLRRLPAPNERADGACTSRRCAFWRSKRRRPCSTRAWIAASPPARRRDISEDDTHMAATAEKALARAPLRCRRHR